MLTFIRWWRQYGNDWHEGASNFTDEDEDEEEDEEEEEDPASSNTSSRTTNSTNNKKQGGYKEDLSVICTNVDKHYL